MIKLTTTPAMRILTIKALGLFINISFGKSAKSKTTPKTTPKNKIIWTHSYEQACAATAHANLIMIGIYGRIDFSENIKLRTEWLAQHDHYLRNQPKLTRRLVENW